MKSKKQHKRKMKKAHARARHSDVHQR